MRDIALTIQRIALDRIPGASTVKSKRTTRRSPARDTPRARSDQLLTAFVAAIRAAGSMDTQAAIGFIDLIEQRLLDLEQRQDATEQVLATEQEATRARLHAALNSWVAAIGVVLSKPEDTAEME
jgi:hypothetical protein